MKNQLSLWICLAIQSLVLTSASEAALFHDIDTTVPLKCVFSSSHQNRVGIDRGRIEKAIFADGKVAIQLEETSGQMFVYALDCVTDPVVISIVTDLGAVQDLEVTFEDRSSEVVILTNPKAKTPRDRGIATVSGQISGLLDDIIRGKTPYGYARFEGGDACHSIGRGVFAKTMAQFEGPTDTIYILKVTNQKIDSVQLHERQFTGEFGRWVYLAKSHLDPQEVTLAVLAVERAGKTRKPLLGDL